MRKRKAHPPTQSAASRTKPQESKVAAVVTIWRAQHMTKRGRKQIANWLRQQARWLERSGDNYSGRFTGRYYTFSRFPYK